MAEQKNPFPFDFRRMNQVWSNRRNSCSGCEPNNLKEIGQDILRALREESKRKYLPEARLINSQDDYNNILRPIICKQQIAPSLNPYKTEAALAEFAQKYLNEGKGRERFDNLRASAAYTRNPFKTDYTNVYSDFIDAAVADSCDLFSNQRGLQQTEFRQGLSRLGEVELLKVLTRMFPVQ